MTPITMQSVVGRCAVARARYFSRRRGAALGLGAVLILVPVVLGMTPASTPAATILEYVGAQKETGAVDGLSGAQSLALSFGERLYVPANLDSAVSYFSREPTLGDADRRRER